MFSAPGALFVKVLSCSLFVVAVKNTLALGEEERVGLRKRPCCPAAPCCPPAPAVGVKIGCGVGVALDGLGVGEVGEVGRLDKAAGSLGEDAMEVGKGEGGGWRKK